MQIVDAKEMAALQQMNARRSSGRRFDRRQRRWSRRRAGARTPQSGAPAEITVLGQTYRLGQKSGRTWSMNKLDQFEILKEVRSAKKLADLVIFTIHAHEGQQAPGEGDTPYPADFLPVLFHNVIDAGADVVAGHGSHALRGIEIYKGRPIFYGLSTFLFQGYILSTQDNRDQRNLDPRFTSRGETETRLNGGPPPGAVDKTGLLGSWDVSILPVMTYEGGRVKEIRIYPIDVRRSAQVKAERTSADRVARAWAQNSRPHARAFGAVRYRHSHRRQRWRDSPFGISTAKRLVSARANVQYIARPSLILTGYGSPCCRAR